MSQFITAPTVEKATPLLLADYLHIIDSADTNNDKWIRAQRIVEMLGNGWTPANETWTYASATTMTVPAGALLKYSVGMKVKWTEGTTVKYAYIVTVTDTLLTFAGTAITNTTILTPYYSAASNPAGFTHWFDYVPDLTLGAAELSGYDIARLMIVGRTCHLKFRADNRSVSGSTGTIRISTPVNTVDYSSFSAKNQACVIGNNYIELWKDLSFTNWATGETGQYIVISGSYEI